MSRVRKVHNPYDFLSTVNYNEFPKEDLESLEIPGIFETNLSRKVYGGNVLEEADRIFISQPDGKTLKERSAYVFEHLSKKIDETKGVIIGDYVKDTYVKTLLPVIPVVASKYNDVTENPCYKIDAHIHMDLVLLNLDENFNRKKLNNVKNKLEHSNELSIADGMDLSNAILYAPPGRELEVLYEARDYYLKSNIKNSRLRFLLYFGFYCMADAYIDDKNEFNEMVKLIQEKQNPAVLEEASTLIYMQNKLASTEDFIKKQEETFSKEISERDNTISELSNEISERDNTISELSNEISERDNILDNIKELVNNSSDISVFMSDLNQLLFRNSPN